MYFGNFSFENHPEENLAVNLWEKDFGRKNPRGKTHKLYLTKSLEFLFQYQVCFWTIMYENGYHANVHYGFFFTDHDKLAQIFDDTPKSSSFYASNDASFFTFKLWNGCWMIYIHFIFHKTLRKKS